MSSLRYAGLDVHKHLIVVCIIDETGQILRRHRCGCSRTDLEQLGRHYLVVTNLFTPYFSTG